MESQEINIYDIQNWGYPEIPGISIDPDPHPVDAGEPGKPWITEKAGRSALSVADAAAAWAAAWGQRRWPWGAAAGPHRPHP